MYDDDGDYDGGGVDYVVGDEADGLGRFHLTLLPMLKTPLRIVAIISP